MILKITGCKNSLFPLKCNNCSLSFNMGECSKYRQENNREFIEKR